MESARSGEAKADRRQPAAEASAASRDAAAMEPDPLTAHTLRSPARRVDTTPRAVTQRSAVAGVQNSPRMAMQQRQLADVSSAIGSKPPVQAAFDAAQIRRLARLKMQKRIEVLSRVSEEDLDSWYESGEFGSLLLGAEESDEISARRQELADAAEVDALVGSFRNLGLDEVGDSPMDVDPMAALPGIDVSRLRSDADGEVVMQDIDGGVSVGMTDVHGSMDVEMQDVEGTVEMEIERVDADTDIRIMHVDGYVHVTLMDVDLASADQPPGVLRLDIRNVQGILDLRVEHSGEPMDISVDGVEQDEHVTRRVDKRKRQPDELAPPEAERRRKRARVGGGTASGATSSDPSPGLDPDVEALTSGISALDIREPFFAQMDSAVHELYPAPDRSDLMVHSDPVPLSTVIKAKRWQNTAIGGGAIATLKALQGTATAALKAMSSPTKTKANALRKAMKDIAKELAKVKGVPLPKTVLSGDNHPSNTGTTEGKRAKADPLSLNTQNKGTIGSGPTNTSRLRNAIKTVAKPLGENKAYKMMHLLNHKVFGPGELWNMTPGPAASNVRMEKDIEEPLKRAIHDKGLVMGLEATVDYRADPMAQTQAELNRNPDGYRFKKIDFTAWEYELNHGGTAFDAVSATPDADVQAIDGHSVRWDYGGLTVLRDKPRILDPATTKQDLRDAGLPESAVNKIWQFNQDVAAGKRAAFTVPSSNKKEALMLHIRQQNKDTRKASDTWDATKVYWR